MEGGLLSLKWNNHKSTFFHVLSNVRKKKDNYADATLACDGQFYPVHKLVLSSCSDYFEEMFAQAGQAKCKHPFIVLKDIKSDELECLLSYMYIGEVNVVQEKLSGLIKAAECLRIKGLAVPDEEPPTNSKPSREKRHGDNSVSSESKRRKQEDISHSTPISRDSYSRSEERRKHSADSNSSNKFRNSSSSNNSFREDSESGVRDNVHHSKSVVSSSEAQEVKLENLTAEVDPPDEVLLDESNDMIKSEPNDTDGMYDSMVEHKDQMLLDGFEDASAENQQHFMDQLLANSSAVDHQQMGDFTGEGDPSLSAGGSQQQPVVDYSHDAISYMFDSVDTSQNLFKNGSSSTNSSRSTIRKKVFQPRKSLLKTHIPLEHLGDISQFKVPNSIRYRCPVCHKEMNSSNHFINHYRVHSGEKPYHCCYCNYKATQAPHLQYHLRTKHNANVKVSERKM